MEKEFEKEFILSERESILLIEMLQDFVSFCKSFSLNINDKMLSYSRSMMYCSERELNN